MAYDPILDDELIPGAPGTSSLFTRLRDNVLAIIQGLSGAPGIERKAILASSAEVDGAWIDGTTIAGHGYFEPSSILFTVSRSLPGVCIARCGASIQMAGTITLDAVSRDQARAATLLMRARVGQNGVDGAIAAQTSGGGASCGGGAAADTAAGEGVDFSLAYRAWNSLLPIIGGSGGRGIPSDAEAYGGGSLILLVEGDCDLTGCTIKANGAAGVAQASSAVSGGAAGGSIIIGCTGTMTNGTFEAKGGSNASANASGGGGYIGTFASAYAGSQSYNTDGGDGRNTAPYIGYHDKATLTAAQIRAMLFRSY